MEFSCKYVVLVVLFWLKDIPWHENPWMLPIMTLSVSCMTVQPLLPSPCKGEKDVCEKEIRQYMEITCWHHVHSMYQFPSSFQIEVSAGKGKCNFKVCIQTSSTLYFWTWLLISREYSLLKMSVATERGREKKL